MKQKLHIKKGDLVKVIAGDSKGHEGKILRINPEEKMAVVEGANMVKKHTKPNAKYTQGGIIEREAPVHISNLQLVDAKGQLTRTGRRLNADNKLVRYSKKSGEEIK
jgi:large subunit ribosomal protein L24